MDFSKEDLQKTLDKILEVKAKIIPIRDEENKDLIKIKYKDLKDSIKKEYRFLDTKIGLSSLTHCDRAFYYPMIIDIYAQALKASSNGRIDDIMNSLNDAYYYANYWESQIKIYSKNK